MSDSNYLEKRKKDHLQMALAAQVDVSSVDLRFFYEPLFSAHPKTGEGPKKFTFLGKEMWAPFWISSMTGGTDKSLRINKNLARASAEFGLGMGLGSCRPLLEDDRHFEDFNLRPILGDSRPFYANLGIAQIEKQKGDYSKICKLVERLGADGLIIHINLLQEFLQPEGDRLEHPPIYTLQNFLEKFPFKVIVKEVGQGFGPQSLKALMELPLAALEFGGFGGTNFSKLEILRGKKDHLLDLVQVGHTPEEMINFVKQNLPQSRCKEFIISGGVDSYIKAYYLRERLGPNSITGMARAFLEKASLGYEELRKFCLFQIEGYTLCEKFLRIRS
jgi:isopentenyl-diphosphate delta-isomerase